MVGIHRTIPEIAGLGFESGWPNNANPFHFRGWDPGIQKKTPRAPKHQPKQFASSSGSKQILPSLVTNHLIIGMLLQAPVITKGGKTDFQRRNGLSVWHQSARPIKKSHHDSVAANWISIFHTKNRQVGVISDHFLELLDDPPPKSYHQTPRIPLASFYWSRLSMLCR